MKTTQINATKLITNIKYLGVAALFIGGLATFSGCATKGCTDESADNYNADATEDDGTCIPARDKFLGQWKGTGCSFEETFTITTSSTDGKVLITSATDWFDCDGDGNYDEPISVTASVSGESFTVESTDRCSGGFSQTGSGTLTGTVLTFNITGTPSGGGTPLTCTFPLSKL